jgi:negative regulator of sigma E activity
MPAAAAAVAVVVIGYGVSKLRQPTVLPPDSGLAPAIAFASEKQHVVTGVRPVATFRDAAKRPWRLMEVTWTEQDTLVSTSVPTLVRVEENRSALVPVAVRFD